MGGDRVRLVIWGTFGCFGFLVFLLILKLLTRLNEAKAENYQKKSTRNPMALALVTVQRSAAVAPTVLRDFSLAQLEAATDHFNSLNLIKIGHSGDFFAGILEGEERVVVKRMKMSADEEEVQRELEIHGSDAVVPLLGQAGLQFLVYKFVGNGDLATALAKGRRVLEDDNHTMPSSLPWITRLKIATGTARALFHLHHHSHPPLLHKDIKSSSILLTEEFEVCLGSLSSVEKVESEALLSYDIICFGRVLLDLISGLDVSGCEDPYAEAWVSKALPCIESGYSDSLVALIDPSLVVEEDFTREILGVAALARACLDPNCVKYMNMGT
ncbi:hypothetical protein KI387_030291, partial [Taxus chinensis]